MPFSFLWSKVNKFFGIPVNAVSSLACSRHGSGHDAAGCHLQRLAALSWTDSTGCLPLVVGSRRLLEYVVNAEATCLLQVVFMAIFAFILGLPMLKSYVAFSAVVSWIDATWLSGNSQLMLVASCGEATVHLKLNFDMAGSTC